MDPPAQCIVCLLSKILKIRNSLRQIMIPYRTKIRRTKLSKFRLGVENFVRRKILSVENFVQRFNTKVRQKSDKIVEISAWCRKFCPTKYFVRRKFCPTKFCPIRYIIPQTKKEFCESETQLCSAHL